MSYLMVGHVGGSGFRRGAEFRFDFAEDAAAGLGALHVDLRDTLNGSHERILARKGHDQNVQRLGRS